MASCIPIGATGKFLPIGASADHIRISRRCEKVPRSSLHNGQSCRQSNALPQMWSSLLVVHLQQTSCCNAVEAAHPADSHTSILPLSNHPSIKSLFLLD